jgi:hypothetical protein
MALTTSAHLLLWLRKIQEVDPLLDAPDPRLPGGVGVITHMARSFESWLASPAARGFPDKLERLSDWLLQRRPADVRALDYVRRPLLFEDCPLLFVYWHTSTARADAPTLFPYADIKPKTRDSFSYLRFYLALHRRFYCGTRFRPHLDIVGDDEFGPVADTVEFFVRQQRGHNVISVYDSLLVRHALADARITRVTFRWLVSLVANAELLPLSEGTTSGAEDGGGRALKIVIDENEGSPSGAKDSDPARLLLKRLTRMKRHGIEGTTGAGGAKDSRHHCCRRAPGSTDICGPVPIPETRISLLKHLGERTAPTPSVSIECHDIFQLTETMRVVTLPESTTSLSIAVQIASRMALTRCLAETLGSERFRHLKTLHIRTIGLNRTSRLTRLRKQVRRARARYAEEWYRDVCSAIGTGFPRIPWHFHTISSRLTDYACPFPPELETTWHDD